MPRSVDPDERRDAIADAALSLARAEGLTAVSFRRVAKAMGASSTTVVRHYASTRRDLIELMFAKLFADLQRLAEQVLPLLGPSEALLVLAEGVLPIEGESRLIAKLGLEAALEFGAEAVPGGAVESFGGWLHDHVHHLVGSIGSPLGDEAAADVIVGALAGITLYGLVDPETWSPTKQRDAIHTLLAALGLNAGH